MPAAISFLSIQMLSFSGRAFIERQIENAFCERMKAIRRFSLIIIALVVFTTGGFFLFESGAKTTPGTTEKQLYTCGMDPQVVQDHPGKCMICGMTLTPMPASSHSNAMDQAAIVVNPVTLQNMGYRSETVRRGPLTRVIRTSAAIEFDETRLADVTARFRGWIDKLYADSTGQQVHRGDPLFEIHSPELYSAEMEYFLTLTPTTTNMGGMPGNTMKARAVAKLKMFDMSDEQIAKIERDREVRKSLSVVSPADGFITEKSVVQGQMVDTGTKLYRIADLEFVWVQAQIYEQDLPFLKLGQEADVTLSYLPDRKFRGRIAYIYPTLDEKTRTVKVRMEFHNPGFLLKPGMFATVELQAELAADALLVPESAVLRSGEKNTVFVVRDGGKFEPRTVALGPQGEHDVLQVLSGLEAGERIVTSGQFLLDSESQLREAIQKMLPPTPAHSPAQTVDLTTNAAAPNPFANSSIVFICPMDEHMSIRYDHSGKCPLCNMTLVPVSEANYNRAVSEKWQKEHPSAVQL
jgi:Cu(I)/Ag(I) efflux system membrane fusion protein